MSETNVATDSLNRPAVFAQLPGQDPASMMRHALATMQATTQLMACAIDMQLRSSYRLLTSQEFADRVGGVTAETVETWVEKRMFGKFKHVQYWGRKGMRIPEFY